MTPEGVVPFRAGREPGIVAEPMAVPAFSGPTVLLADLSEFQANLVDALYLAWSRAIVIRCLYGTAHQDHAWYGGQRRALLHAGGARFVGIYAYLVAGQSGASQAQAFHDLVGPIRSGEVFIADFEEGAEAVLEEWRTKMLALYGTAIRPWLWTYTGLSFGESRGVLPVEWIAAYRAAEPSTRHRLWQFTSGFQVPGVGVADCSVFHGDIDQLAALAFQPSKPKPPPGPPPPPHPGPAWPAGTVLREGDSGAAVRALQTALSDSGIRGVRGITVDSVFGQQTLTSLRNFQAARGLTVDGIAGNATRSALGFR
jgi:hypothetical protein